MLKQIGWTSFYVQRNLAFMKKDRLHRASSINC